MESSLEKSKTFCILPWLHLHVMPDSSVLPCCVSPYKDSFGDGKTQTIEEIINSEKFKTLRQNMLAGIPSAGCSRCYKLEKNGFFSMRNEMNHAFKKYFHLAETTAPDGKIENLTMKYVDIRFSNLCNFKCRGCGPTLSSAWYEDHQAVYDYQATAGKVKSISVNSPRFWSELKEIIPDADIIYFGGGEPLITKEHFEILSLLIEQKKFDVELRYNTNLSTLNYGPYHLSELWSQFKKVDLSISIDDLGKRAEYYRHGTNWSNMENNMRILMDEYPQINRDVNCTVNIFNVYYLPELIRYLFDRGFVEPARFHFNLLLDPDEYRVDILPLAIKEKVVNKLTKFKIFIAGSGEQYLKTECDLEKIIKFMMESDRSASLSQFRDVTAKLDKIRGESFANTFPEISEFLV